MERHSEGSYDGPSNHTTRGFRAAGPHPGYILWGLCAGRGLATERFTTRTVGGSATDLEDQSQERLRTLRVLHRFGGRERHTEGPAGGIGGSEGQISDPKSYAGRVISYIA